MTGVLDWLVVGGGIHGTHLSHVLVHAAGVPADRVRVLDREPVPLAAFWRCVEACGMTSLRSPGVHHLDLHPYSLLQFARTEGRRVAGFVPPYDRPKLPLFRAHCDYVIERHGLHALRAIADTYRIVAQPWGYRVETSAGHLDTKRVVLALGAGGELALPRWAEGTQASWHIFHADFTRPPARAHARVAIIGGGITAAQLALSLARDGARPTVVARHPIREHRFDSDPGWLGPLEMERFARGTPATRRALIGNARHRGSLTPELRRAVARAERDKKLAWLHAEVAGVAHTGGEIVLTLGGPPDTLVVDHLAFATGFERARPGGRLVAELVETLGLPCAACGYPLLGESLAWRPGLYVSGALAELELGPTARNIAGARAAGERLLRVARQP
ncbi:MAG: FAD/NAD(P)-binding protein [Kofleriaceae bacterium]|nr:FAD/NAD(P)-binding protein [Kofleriaceae bacterium]